MRLSRVFQIGDRAVAVFLLLTERRNGDWMPRAWVPMIAAGLAFGAYALADLAWFLVR